MVVLKENFSNKSTIAIFQLFSEYIGRETIEEKNKKLISQGYTRLYYVPLFPEFKNLAELSAELETANKSFPGDWDKYISELLEPFISHIRFEITLPEDNKLQDCIETRIKFVKKKIKTYELIGIKSNEITYA